MEICEKKIPIFNDLRYYLIQSVGINALSKYWAYKGDKVLKLFKSTDHSILGIDISSSAVKMLEISGSADKPCVESYGCQLLPPDVLDGILIKDVAAVANCIKNLLNSTTLNCKKVAIAVPDSAVISKVVQINEGLHDAEIEELVVIDADKYIPYPIDEINLDFEVLGRSVNNPTMLDVLVVASRSENVNTRVEAIQLAGLEASIVDVESYAVARAVRQQVNELSVREPDKIIAIIDIGAHFTHLFVLQGMRIIFSREEKFGGQQLTEAIAEHYNMSVEQAGVAKALGKLPAEYEVEVLAPFNKMVLLQIKRTLQFFYSATHYGFVDHLLLAGGVACQKGLLPLIRLQLGITVSIAHPFAHMSFGEMVDKKAISKDAPALIVACGLALRRPG